MSWQRIFLPVLLCSVGISILAAIHFNGRKPQPGPATNNVGRFKPLEVGARGRLEPFGHVFEVAAPTSTPT